MGSPILTGAAALGRRERSRRLRPRSRIGGSSESRRGAARACLQELLDRQRHSPRRALPGSSRERKGKLTVAFPRLGHLAWVRIYVWLGYFSPVSFCERSDPFRIRLRKHSRRFLYNIPPKSSSPVITSDDAICLIPVPTDDITPTPSRT